MALKLRGAAAAIKRNPFPFKRPPRPDSFKRWLDSDGLEARGSSAAEFKPLVVRDMDSLDLGND